MCQGNCPGCNDCAAQGTPGPPGRQGDPGATPDITFTAQAGAPGSGVILVQGGTALNPTVGMTIGVGEQGDPGAPGTPAVNLYTTLVNAFTIPALNSSTLATVGNTSWMRVGAWIRMADGGNAAAYLYIAAVPSSTTVLLANRGSTAGWPDGVALQPVPGTVISPDSTEIQIQAAAVPGLPGEDGTPGDPGDPGPPGPPSSIQIVYTAPVSAPSSPEENFVFLANETPPTPATSFVGYAWNGAAWIAGPNIAGAAGSQTFFGTADPNVVPVSGSNTGDAFWQISTNSAVAWKKTSPSLWVNSGTLSTSGSTTQDISHTVAGTQVLDLAYFSFAIDLKDDITLNWSDTNFSGQGTWVVTMENTSGGAVDLNVSAARWEEDSAMALALPLSIPNGETRVVRFVQNPISGLYTITSLYTPSAL